MASPDADLHIQSAASAGLASLHRFVQTLLSAHEDHQAAPSPAQPEPALHTIAPFHNLLSSSSSSPPSSCAGTRPTLGHARLRKGPGAGGAAAAPSSSNDSSSISLVSSSSSLSQISNTTTTMINNHHTIDDDELRDHHLLEFHHHTINPVLPAGVADGRHIHHAPASASSCGGRPASPHNYDLHLSLDLNQEEASAIADHADDLNLCTHCIITTAMTNSDSNSTREFSSDPPLQVAEATISSPPSNNFSLFANGLSSVNQNISLSLYHGGTVHGSHGHYSIDCLTGASSISAPHDQYHQMRGPDILNRTAPLISATDQIPQKSSAGSTSSLTNTSTADNLIKRPCISLDKTPQLDLSLMASGPLKRKLSDSEHSEENCTCSSKRRKHKNKTVKMVPAISDKIADIPADDFAWRKYGQKPIKGSPYPRGYYKCSGVRGCLAKKHVERAKDDPGMLIITYEGEHNHSQRHHPLAPYTHQERILA